MPESKIKPKLVVICGPTGIGKTKTAIEVAETFGGEIINADSMQVYRSMTIGTAKPTAGEQAHIPHHMVDVVDPGDDFDAARFSLMAHQIAHDITARGVIPIVAGGTGLYIKAMIYGLFQTDPPDPAIRRKLKAEADSIGSVALHKRLRKMDPEAAERIHANDTFRIIRALETIGTTGQRISDHHRQHGFRESSYHVIKIGLDMERERLYERINERVDAMIAAGLLDEVRKLLESGIDSETKAMRALGYRHMVDYLKFLLPWKEAVRTMKRDTRRFAKRQLAWFRADKDIIWTSPKKISDLYPRIQKFLITSK